MRPDLVFIGLIPAGADDRAGVGGTGSCTGRAGSVAAAVLAGAVGCHMAGPAVGWSSSSIGSSWMTMAAPDDVLRCRDVRRRVEPSSNRIMYDLCGSFFMIRPFRQLSPNLSLIHI